MADFATATQHVEAAPRRQVRRGKLLLLDVSDRQWRDAMQINPQAVTHTQTAHREKGEAWEWDAAGRRIRRSTMQSRAPSPDDASTLFPVSRDLRTTFTWSSPEAAVMRRFNGAPTRESFVASSRNPLRRRRVENTAVLVIAERRAAEQQRRFAMKRLGHARERFHGICEQELAIKKQELSRRVNRKWMDAKRLQHARQRWHALGRYLDG